MVDRLVSQLVILTRQGTNSGRFIQARVRQTDSPLAAGDRSLLIEGMEKAKIKQGEGRRNDGS